MRQLWLSCPECGEPGALLCEVRGALPDNLALVYQDCACDHPEDAWPQVCEEAHEKMVSLAYEEAQERLYEQREKTHGH